MRYLIFVSFAALLLVAVFWSGPEPRTVPGVLVPYEPERVAIIDPTQWTYKDCRITTVAHLRLRARVLLTEHYSTGDEAALAPVDLTVGWRLMSNQDILDELRLFRMPRSYGLRFRNTRLPARPPELANHSANLSLIPSSDDIARRLDAVERTDLIDLSAYFVEVRFPSGRVWRSSAGRPLEGVGPSQVLWVSALSKM